MTQFDASICCIYCVVSLTEISAFLFSRYFFSSRMILFLRLLQAFSAQHSILHPATLDSIQLNPTSSKVLSGTFGRDIGRPRAIRRKGMQDGQRFICSRTGKEQVVNRCVGMCTCGCVSCECICPYIRSPCSSQARGVYEHNSLKYSSALARSCPRAGN